MKSILPCLLLVSGCAFAPHGSKATHEVYTYVGRDDHLVRIDRWTDKSAGGGCFFLMDPTLQSVAYFHTNLNTGNGGQITIGNAAVTVDPQTGAIISSAGTAAGNIIGAALKTAAKP